MKDATNQDLMIVGIYRSNEVDDTHLLSKLVRDIRDERYQELHKVDFTELKIGDLNVASVHEMLHDLLSTPADEPDKEADSNTSDGEKEELDKNLLPLAKLCHARTRGNPFYLVHFTASLEEKGLLHYSAVLSKWKWDLRRIERATKATDNVVDLLRAKMCRMSSEIRKVLQAAALLGSTFQAETLEVVWDSIKEDTQQETNSDEFDDISMLLSDCLESCEVYGFIESQGDGHRDRKYRWVHDNIQEAALSLKTSDEEHENLKLQVGQILWSKLSGEQLESNIFVVANLLNGDEPTSQQAFENMGESNRMDLVQVNLQAAQQAVNFSAFDNAASYAERGIQLVPSDWWSKHYDLCLELYSLAAEVEKCLGNHDKLQVYCDQILQQDDRPIMDKMRAYDVLTESVGNHNTKEAAKICLSVLKQCGCHFPESDASMILKVAVKMVRVKTTLKKRTPEELERLPILDDPMRLATIKIVDRLCVCSFFHSSPLVPLTLFRTLDWTLKYGISEASSPAFAMIGVIMAGSLNDLKGARIYAEYALGMLEKLGTKRYESRTMFIVFASCLHWTNPLQDMLNPLLRAYESGMQVGDTEHAVWAIYFYILYSFFAGRSLEAIERDFRIYSVQMKELNREPTVFQCQMCWQLVLNLAGKSDNTTLLTGEAMDEATAQKDAQETPLALSAFQSFQMLAHSYFGDYEFCANYALVNGDSIKDRQVGNACVAVDACHRGLALLAMARKTKSRKYVKAAVKGPMAQIKNWLKQGNPYVNHWSSLLDAELAALNGRKQTAKKRYERAVVLAAGGGFMQDAAIASERYGRFLIETEGPSGGNEATFRLKEAAKFYSEWGAHARLRVLREEFPDLWPVPNEIVAGY